MKALAVSLILFILIVSATTANGIYSYGTLNKIDELSNEISSSAVKDSQALIQQLESFWLERRSLLGFGIQESKLERMSELIISLKCAHELNSPPDIKRLCSLIHELCEEIIQYEKISFQGIF